MTHTPYIITAVMAASGSKDLIQQSYYNWKKGDEGHLGWSETYEVDMSCSKYLTDFSSE